MKNLSLLIFFKMLLICGHSQEVDAVADKTAILIGEQLKLELRAEFKKGQAVKWMEVDSMAGFEILNSSEIDTQLTELSTILTQKIILTSWDSGEWKIPSFILNRSRTKPITITVSFTEMDPNKPYNEIKAIIPVQRPGTYNWWWYFIFGAILAGLFFLFFPSSKKNIVKKDPEPVDAYKDAIYKLDNLKVNDALDHKKFHTELIHIFRQYLHRKKNIHSFSKTTGDLVIQIKSLQLPQKEYTQLSQALQISDMVKFAKYQPLPEENQQAIITIRENIDIIENLNHAV